ncbi:MAG TPA: DUF1318 domain-containing protein [Rhodospirillaceae bacterium]|nr:DUF1318 domain-containing protein [Rhodospirillaceae bacterium]
MKKLIQTTLMTAIIIGFAAGSAFAMDLSSAKSSGLVGEKANGLIEATLPNPSADIVDLVNTTNAGRLDVYKQMADKQGIPLKEVQAIAAQKIYDLAAPGEFLMQNGKWTKK